jgi:hypothetical protein
LTRKRPDRVLVTAPVLPRTWSHGVPGDFEPPPGTAHSYRLRLIPTRPFACGWFSNKPQAGAGRRTRPESLEECQKRTGDHPSGAEAPVDLSAVMAPFVSAQGELLKSCPFKTASRMAISGQVPGPVAETSALRGVFPPQVSQMEKMKRGLYV